MKHLPFALLIGLCVCFPAGAQPNHEENAVTVSGLIVPRDDQGMYLRNPDGQFEIEWTDKTEIALVVNTRQQSPVAPNAF